MIYVLGVGARRGVGAAELGSLVADVLHEAGIGHGEVRALATLALKGGESGIIEMCARYRWESLIFHADTLAAIPVGNPDERVRQAVGTGSVAEAAALAGAGRFGRAPELVVGKRRSAGATAALAKVAAARTGHEEGSG